MRKTAFTGGFEHAGAVALQRGMHPLQRRHSYIQSRELLLNLCDDALLRERLGLAGRRRFEEHYAWPVIIERHYRPLLDRPAVVR